VFEVRKTSGEQVVDGDDAPAFGEQGVAKMGSEKTGATRDQSAF
jgi:hypothetical protein